MQYTLAEIRNGSQFEESDKFERVDTRDEEKQQKLAEIGRSAYESIAELVAALNCDYDRLEELREEKEANQAIVASYQEKMLDWQENADATEALEELAELEKSAGECEDREDAERRIQEDALSLEFRSGWCSSKEDMVPEEFNLLLATGGPAVRIIGEIRNGEPHNPRLQVQDWFLPWTEYMEADTDVLLDYCRCFYFGE